MFNPGVSGNARVNGHVPGLAGNHDRKRKGKLPGPYTTNQVQAPASSSRQSNSQRSNSCNGQLKFADRLKGLRGLLLSNGDDAYQNREDNSDLSDVEDPYTFNEPEPVRKYSTQSAVSAKSVSKTTPKSVMKNRTERGASNSSEPTGLNMTRLYPAFFEPNSSQLPLSTNSNSSSKTTLASLLESSSSDDVPPKRNDFERTFSSFSAKDINCFPNLTSPPPPEQPSQSVATSTKISPVKHGMPTTPQRESNKLAALFSPTYLNSIRNDKSKIRKISTPRNQSREKIIPRVLPCDRRAPKEVTIKSAAAPTMENKKTEEASKTTLSRLQDKIARKMVMGKQQRKLASKSVNEPPQRRHSVNDMPLKKERSLLEEQLLSQKPIKPLKKDEVGLSLSLSAGLTPPPAATTRVPGVNGPLTYGVAKISPNIQRSSGNISRKEKPHATYGGQKSSKTTSNGSSQAPAKSSSILRQGVNGSIASVFVKSEVNRSHKRPRTKLDLAGDALKHGSIMRLHSHKETKYDVFTRTNVIETDSDDSDLEEGLVYQKHWFSGWMEAGSGLASEERRENRLLQIRAEFRRKLNQVWGARRDPGVSSLPKCVVDSALKKPSQTAVLLSPNQRWHRTGRSKLSMLVPKQCVFGKQGEGELCTSPALPCAHHCVRHITYNVEQLLFEHCTAKFSDNTQCCVPVFDSSHELPLCSEHARKLDDYNRLSQVVKPKRVRKKSKPSAMTRSTKRNKKKKQKPSLSSQPSPLPPPSPPALLAGTAPSVQAQARIQRSQSLPVDSLSRQDSEDYIDGNTGIVTPSSPEETTEIYVTDETYGRLSESQLNVHDMNGVGETIVDVADVTDVPDVDVEEEALELAELPELTDAGDLGQQDGSLLEGHDLTNVLNEIPTIAFTDLFGEEDKDMEPTREETEELERALAAVDKDVKSLQNMGSQILLDYKAQDLLQTSEAQAQAQVFLEVDKLSPSQGLLDIDKLQAQGLFDVKNQGLLDNLLDDHTLVQTLTQLPPDLPSSSSSLVYYHNGYTINGGGIEKNLCAANGNTGLIYQAPGIVGAQLPTQTDLH
ncbi:INO80 complex subunit D [Frankliniella fusca]|uniref:INO80 complex subunit D n=1 Tax=Frankliniella fusca TaxID=407009 RepID=A0AAE1GSS6_9NEOP|nr:INO80 complex subunit D [Frankliniella fusca]